MDEFRGASRPVSVAHRRMLEAEASIRLQKTSLPKQRKACGKPLAEWHSLQESWNRYMNPQGITNPRGARDPEALAFLGHKPHGLLDDEFVERLNGCVSTTLDQFDQGGGIRYLAINGDAAKSNGVKKAGVKFIW